MPGWTKSVWWVLLIAINQIYNNIGDFPTDVDEASKISLVLTRTIISGIPPLVSHHPPVLDLVSGSPRTWYPLALYLTWYQSGSPSAFSSLLCLIAGVFIVRAHFLRSPTRELLHRRTINFLKMIMELCPSKNMCIPTFTNHGAFFYCYR